MWTHAEEWSSSTLFADDYTEAGLFKQLRTSSGYKVIVGKGEVSQFFEQILGVKNKNRLDVRRLTQLSHGATWCTQEKTSPLARYESNQ